MKIKLIYEQIKDKISSEITTKEPGEFLNSEVQYSKIYNVSRPTIRKAVDELIQEGLVKRIPGKGLQVSDGNVLTGELLIMIPYNPEFSFFYNIINGCIECANEHKIKYNIINALPEDRLKTIEAMDLSDYSYAIITAYEYDSDYKFIQLLKDNNITVVLVDNPLKNSDLPYVTVDDYMGGYIAGSYLIEKGHKKILYITGPSNITTVSKRKKGFINSLIDNNIEIDSNYIHQITANEEIIDVLEKFKYEYTSICCSSDIPLIKAYHYLTAKGLNIPDDISLMGYGDDDYASLLPVPLTTIKMPTYLLGYKAVELLVDIIKNDSYKNTILDVELVERDTVKQIKDR